jgi:hypothetical protein
MRLLPYLNVQLSRMTSRASVHSTRAASAFFDGGYRKLVSIMPTMAFRRS